MAQNTHCGGFPVCHFVHNYMHNSITKGGISTFYLSNDWSNNEDIYSVAQQATCVNMGRTECPLYSHIQSKNGVVIEQIWTATVFEFCYRCYPERRPYSCVWIMPSQRDTNLNLGTDESEHEREATPPQPKRHHSLLLCGHCETYLPKSTCYRHKERYFNVVSNQ